MVAMFSNFHRLFVINLESLNFKKIVINICNKITIQTFKIIFTIGIYFEVRKISIEN